MYISQVEILQHILDECEYLQNEFQQSSFDEFLQNERLSKAICRSLEIIGEACSKIHPDLKLQHKHIPWREMSDLRNKIIHNYFGIDYDIVWDTVKTDIPVLKRSVESIIRGN